MPSPKKIQTFSPALCSSNGKEKEICEKECDASAVRRSATSDEIADTASFLLGEHATFINGTDLLIDGGVIPAIRTGMFKLQG